MGSQPPKSHSWEWGTVGFKSSYGLAVAGDGTLCKRRALSLYYHSSDAAIMPY